MLLCDLQRKESEVITLKVEHRTKQKGHENSSVTANNIANSIGSRILLILLGYTSTTRLLDGQGPNQIISFMLWWNNVYLPG